MKTYRNVILTYIKRALILPDVSQYTGILWHTYGQVTRALRIQFEYGNDPTHFVLCRLTSSCDCAIYRRQIVIGEMQKQATLLNMKYDTNGTVTVRYRVTLWNE